MNGFFDFVTVCRTLKVYHKRCGQFPFAILYRYGQVYSEVIFSRC